MLLPRRCVHGEWKRGRRAGPGLHNPPLGAPQSGQPVGVRHHSPNAKAVAPLHDQAVGQTHVDPGRTVLNRNQSGPGHGQAPTPRRDPPRHRHGLSPPVRNVVRIRIHSDLGNGRRRSKPKAVVGGRTGSPPCRTGDP
ncbi:hypothetical protein GGP95_002891 [Salinibacter ruber]|nr:hypothetical protein [Salinibacter ruber]